MEHSYARLVSLLEQARGEKQRWLVALEDLDPRRCAGDRPITLEDLIAARDKWQAAHRYLTEIGRAMRADRNRGRIPTLMC